MNLRYWRRARFLSQQELADAVGVSTKTVGGWERGESEPRVRHLQRLCQVLNVTAEQLLGAPEDEGKALAAQTAKYHAASVGLPGVLQHATAAGF